MTDQWFIARNNKKHGPYSMEQLQALAGQGQLAPTDMILKQGEAKWVAASAVEGLFHEQPPTEEATDQGKRATPSPAGNPVAWVQEQFRTNPQRVLLAGGGAALGLLFFLCLGCAGIVSLISGGNRRSDTVTSDMKPASHDGSSPDASEYKKLIVGKWKDAGTDLGALGDAIDEYTADGRIIIWDAKDGAVAGRGKYQFLSANKVSFKIFDSEFGDYTATIRISGDEMTFTFDDGKSTKHRRVGGDAIRTKPSHDVSMFSARAKNAAKMKPFMNQKEVEQLTGKPDLIKRTRLGDTLWLYYANPQRGAEKRAVEIVVGFAKKDPNHASILWIQDKLLFAGNNDYRPTGGLQVGPWKDD